MLLVKFTIKVITMIKERNTKQKTLLLSTLQSVTSHPTAEQMHKMLSDKMPGISLGTVYRNLNKLAEMGTIRRISVNNSPDRYDGDLSPHHHICCNKCGEFLDYFGDYDKSLDEIIGKKSGFSIERHETVFYGFCPNCQL